MTASVPGESEPVSETESGIDRLASLAVTVTAKRPPSPPETAEPDLASSSPSPSSSWPDEPLTASLPEAQAATPELEQRINEATVTVSLALPPLGEGTVIGGRYRILRLLTTEADSNLYEAEDSHACWSCGEPRENADEKFCAACGAELSRWPIVGLREALADSSPSPETEASVVSEGDRRYEIVSAAKAKRPPVSANLRLITGSQTHAGQVRDIDEDSLLLLQLALVCETQVSPLLGFFAVADGIGGGEAGEVASRTAVRSLAEGMMRKVFAPLAGGDQLLPENLDGQLQAAILEANQAILALRQRRGNDMGCTLTAALICHANAIIANVGDSRTYLMRGGALQQVTQDHSVVASLVAAGLAQSEEIYNHEQKNVIYRSLGDKPELKIDTFPLTLQPGDRLLLCCDGLWEMVRDSLIEDVLLQYPEHPQLACEALVKLANESGGEDNISLIIIDVLPFHPPGSP